MTLRDINIYCKNIKKFIEIKSKFKIVVTSEE